MWFPDRNDQTFIFCVLFQRIRWMARFHLYVPYILPLMWQICKCEAYHRSNGAFILSLIQVQLSDRLFQALINIWTVKHLWVDKHCAIQVPLVSQEVWSLSSTIPRLTIFGSTRLTQNSILVSTSSSVCTVGTLKQKWRNSYIFH